MIFTFLNGWKKQEKNHNLWHVKIIWNSPRVNPNINYSSLTLSSLIKISSRIVVILLFHLPKCKIVSMASKEPMSFPIPDFLLTHMQFLLRENVLEHLRHSPNLRIHSNLSCPTWNHSAWPNKTCCWVTIPKAFKDSYLVGGKNVNTINQEFPDRLEFQKTEGVQSWAT